MILHSINYLYKYLVIIGNNYLVKTNPVIFPENFCILKNYTPQTNRPYKKNRIGSGHSKVCNQNTYESN